MFARHKLKTRGYICMYHAVPEKMVDNLRSLSREEKYWIYDTLDASFCDVHRLRACVLNQPACEMMRFLKRFHLTFFADSSMTGLHFLKIIGGAPDQLPRREFEPVTPSSESLNVCSVPGLFFLVMQDSTYFYVYGWNCHVPVQTNQQLIELNKGDILMLRGDCIYAMVGGEASNMVMKAYIDTPLYARPNYQLPEIMDIQDDTRDVDDTFCFAWMCPYVAGTKQSLYKHLNNFHSFFFNRPRVVMP